MSVERSRPVAIVVVEDESGIADFVRRGLEAAGFAVRVESSGADGLVAAQRSDVELLVLDLGLPDLPGERVLARLRAIRPELPCYHLHPAQPEQWVRSH